MKKSKIVIAAVVAVAAVMIVPRFLKAEGGGKLGGRSGGICGESGDRDD